MFGWGIVTICKIGLLPPILERPSVRMKGESSIYQCHRRSLFLQFHFVFETEIFRIMYAY